MTRPTLTDFLFARIAEDEEVALSAGIGPHHADPYWTDADRAAAAAWHVTQRGAAREVRKERHNERAANAPMYAADHIARHDPARVLADVEAKRRIVERHTLHLNSGGGYDEDAELAQWTLEQMALPYAEHPDYREEEWRP